MEDRLRRPIEQRLHEVDLLRSGLNNELGYVCRRNRDVRCDISWALFRKLVGVPALQRRS